jgi:predicted RND superfamily exporter protein
VVDTGSENGILTPDFMARLQKFQKYAESLDFKDVGVGRVNSLVNPLERIHSQLDSNAKANAIPDTEALIQQEILLYEGGGAKEIERLTDRAYSMARITIRLTWEDAREYVELKEQLLKKAQNLFGNTTKITVTGTVDLVSTGVIDIIKSMKNSYLLATFLIGLMLIVLLKQVAFGLACLVPNLLPIYIVLSLMGYMGIPIDMFTVLLGGIALGLAVDDTVHLTHSIVNETHQKQASLIHAVKEGVAKVAPAIIVTTAVISIGFSLFAFSSIAPLSVFGLLLCLVMILALVCDVLVIPALFRLFKDVSSR